MRLPPRYFLMSTMEISHSSFIMVANLSHYMITHIFSSILEKNKALSLLRGSPSQQPSGGILQCAPDAGLRCVFRCPLACIFRFPFIRAVTTDAQLPPTVGQVSGHQTGPKHVPLLPLQFHVETLQGLQGLITIKSHSHHHPDHPPQHNHDCPLAHR